MPARENPWEHLPHESPLAAPVDATLLEHHPEWEEALHLDRLPTPVLGDADAPVLVLSLSPSGKRIKTTTTATPSRTNAAEDCDSRPTRRTTHLTPTSRTPPGSGTTRGSAS